MIFFTYKFLKIGQTVSVTRSRMKKISHKSAMPNTLTEPGAQITKTTTGEPEGQRRQRRESSEEKRKRETSRGQRMNMSFAV